jgi:hypothetical protein
MGLFRHAGLDPASRDPQKHWIPAFAGMTTSYENHNLWTGIITKIVDV